MDILYPIWFLLPLIYLLIGLWTWLEKKGRAIKKQNPGDFFKQGFFITLVVIVCILIDQYLLEDLAAFLPAWIPLLLYRLLLLPLMLYIAALTLGGTKPKYIIGKNRKPGQRVQK